MRLTSVGSLPAADFGGPGRSVPLWVSVSEGTTRTVQASRAAPVAPLARRQRPGSAVARPRRAHAGPLFHVPLLITTVHLA
jgi:hypothetical protein